MYKKKSIKKLGLPADHRKSLMKSQVRDLIKYGYIKTTKSRSKVISSIVDKLADYIFKGNKKIVFDYLRDKALVIYFENYLSNLDVKTGLVSKVKISNRKGDNSEIVLLELVKKL